MDASEERKEKVKAWLKEPLNLALIGAILLGVILRLYYFGVTKLQPVWWDEAAYGTLAKNYISHIWDGTSIIIGESSIRPPLFSIIWSYLIRVGFGEVSIRFILELLPSILSVFLIYLITKECYDKKTGVIATVIFSTLWIHLFYTGRLLTHIPNIFFLFLSVYYFVKSTKSEFVPKYFFISIASACIGALIRYPEGLILVAYVAYILIATPRLLKEKKFWISGIIGLVPLLIFFAYNYATKGNIFPALLGGSYLQEVQKAFAFSILKFIPAYLQTVFFILFLIGLVAIVFEFIVGYDLFRKSNTLKSHVLILLILIVFYGYFIFSVKGAEDRWMFSTSLPLICIVALGIVNVGNIASNYSNKKVATVIIIALLVYGSYQQFSMSDGLIKNKAESFVQMKQGFEWIKENTPDDSIILGGGIEVYSVYYAERRYESFPANASDIAFSNASYMIAHAFTPQPIYLNEYLQNSQNVWKPVQVYFIDSAQKQPILIIYNKVE